MRNRITLITGGDRGIGRATALALAEKGHQVCIGFRQREESAMEVVEKIRHAGGTAIAVQADIAEEEQVVAMFRQIDRELGPLTGLVNNAAILMPQSTIEAISVQRLATMFATNISGSFLCAREAVKRMAVRHGGEGGSIVNVSSAASRLGAPHEYVDYAASKGAIDTFTTGLAVEVAGEGIRVNAVRPGFIYTEMHADGGEPLRVERVKASLPMKRGGQPEEVAQAILWLLSDEASYVTGSFLDLAGGK
uniref:SDR family oxidoreductase n=1 Tax=Pantoea sp. IMH TaxID=1267600 RepID=UPI000468A287|nr:SDR family oxidoreductase [Pantoea sp. IMH]